MERHVYGMAESRFPNEKPFLKQLKLGRGHEACVRDGKSLAV
jgi:hypothetical protein